MGALGYTADGRVASISSGAETVPLSYNQNGQFSEMNFPGAAQATYTYDGFGQRLIKTISGSYGEIYQYGQDGLLLEETDASGAAQADYIYLNGRPIADLNNASGALYFLHDDLLGAPQIATDADQYYQWYEYNAPFGATGVSGNIIQNLGFPGQYYDAETGFYHNGFRDYVPELGRYLEPDPLGRLGSGNNPYVYVGDNPTNLADPLGVCPNNTCAAALKAAQRDAAGVARAKAAWNALRAAADASGIPPALLAAIALRESDFMNIQEQLQGGGSGPGMGVFQLTNQPGVSTAQAYNIPFAANYAADILASNGAYLATRFPSFTPDQLLQATAASYNMNPYKPGNFTGDPRTIDKGPRITIMVLPSWHSWNAFEDKDEIPTDDVHIASHSDLLCTSQQQRAEPKRSDES